MAKRKVDRYIPGKEGREVKFPDYILPSVDVHSHDDGDRDVVQEYKTLQQETRLIPLPPERLFTVTGNATVTRVVLCRYTGQIFEVDINDYNAVSSTIPQGVYFVSKLTWTIIAPEGNTTYELNKRAIENSVSGMPLELQSLVRSFWNRQLGEGGVSQFDSRNYISPLSKKGKSVTAIDTESGLPASYRKAENNEVKCGTCKFFNGNYCSLWNAEVLASRVCNSWRPKE